MTQPSTSSQAGFLPTHKMSQEEFIDRYNRMIRGEDIRDEEEIRRDEEEIRKMKEEYKYKLPHILPIKILKKINYILSQSYAILSSNITKAHIHAYTHTITIEWRVKSAKGKRVKLKTTFNIADIRRHPEQLLRYVEPSFLMSWLSTSKPYQYNLKLYRDKISYYKSKIGRRILVSHIPSYYYSKRYSEAAGSIPVQSEEYHEYQELFAKVYNIFVNYVNLTYNANHELIEL